MSAAGRDRTLARVSIAAGTRRPIVLSTRPDRSATVRRTMGKDRTLAQRTQRTPRPMLLALVFGVVLVLVGVTASALVAVASGHLSSATLSSVVQRDASLVELFVNGTLRASDLDADGPSPARVEGLTRQLAALVGDDGILRIEIRDAAGRIVASDAAEVVGVTVDASAPMRAALEEGRASAELVDGASEAEAAGSRPGAGSLVQEYLPLVDVSRRPLAVVALWRDATGLLASLGAAQRDVMIVVLVAAVLLAAMLFLVFRAAQARLTRQHRLILDATRRDALTGMLNHGTVVATLADAVEQCRSRGEAIAVALVDVDNFRLFNDTHGHDAADQVLLRVAEVVEREANVTTRHVARYGPDEFLLVLRGGDMTEAEAATNRIRAALEAVSVRFGDSEDLPISVSVGIAAFPRHATAVTELLSAAAVALSEAKASGGDGLRVFRGDEEDRVAIGRLDVLQGLVIAVDSKDRYTKRHSEDVARYAVFLAGRLGFDEELQRTIQLAGLLHDIGKIGIPDVVLRKPSKLTADEYGMFQQHVAVGDAIVRDVPNIEHVRAGIRYHHERWDGNGYLEGLEAEAIPIIGRVLAVADAFSAMTTTRPYRKALPIREALSRLEDAAGGQLQKELVAAFVTGIETAPDAPLPGEDPVGLWRPELWVA
jgi:diguanylate cyclase (GGDEF)-like protein